MSEMLARPTHIPAELVVDFDPTDASGVGEDPWGALARLHAGPPIFYTPHGGGHWIVVDEDAARMINARPDIFSANTPKYARRSPDGSAYVVPLHADPPDHTLFRRILGPLFTPGAVRGREAQVRRIARGLVDGVVDAGACEFTHDIAQHFQLAVFLLMVGLPESRTGELMSWVGAIVRPDSPESSAAATQKLIAFLREIVAFRRANPSDDILSYLLAADYDGRPADDGTVLSICGNLFVGGLDTVTATTSFIMLYLARRPEEREALRRQPRPLRAAVVDELVRRNGTVTNARAVVRDYDLEGVPFRAGDRIALMYHVMGIDPDRFSDPMAVAYDRAPAANIIFGMGAHRCLGAHLARLEMRVLMEEWLAQIPEFEVRPGAEIGVRFGAVWAPAQVPLVWRR